MTPEESLDEAFMRLALAEAERARDLGEVPVGCVLVRNGTVLAVGRNEREAVQDPTAHAEMIALRSAAEQLRSFRLEEVDCYVTLEPCPMCAGALVHSRVRRVVYGASDPKAGAVRTLYNIGEDARLNHRFSVTAGVLGPECGQILTDFFAGIRKRRISRHPDDKPTES